MATPKSRTFKSTWMGREGELIIHYLGSSVTGLRVQEMKWVDSDIIEIQLVKGDGRKPNFQVLASGEI